MRIAIASDEAAQQAKERLTARLVSNGHEVLDSAPMVQDQARPDYAEQVALSVLRHDAERGIIVSSRGVGASVAANRVPGVRAALCHDAYSAHVGAKTEGMNVLVLALHAFRTSGRSKSWTPTWKRHWLPSKWSADCRRAVCSASFRTFAKISRSEICGLRTGPDRGHEPVLLLQALQDEHRHHAASVRHAAAGGARPGTSSRQPHHAGPKLPPR